MLNTRLKVSCDGIPFGNARNVFSQLSRFCPKSATASQSSAPQMMPSRAIVNISISRCKIAGPQRGSGKSPKYFSIVVWQVVLISFCVIRLLCRCPPLNFKCVRPTGSPHRAHPARPTQDRYRHQRPSQQSCLLRLAFDLLAAPAADHLRRLRHA